MRVRKISLSSWRKFVHASAVQELSFIADVSKHGVVFRLSRRFDKRSLL